MTEFAAALTINQYSRLPLRYLKHVVYIRWESVLSMRKRKAAINQRQGWFGGLWKPQVQYGYDHGLGYLDHVASMLYAGNMRAKRLREAMICFSCNNFWRLGFRWRTHPVCVSRPSILPYDF